MDENKLKTIVKEVVNEAVDPIRKQLGTIEDSIGNIESRLDDPDTGLVAINKRLDANTAAVVSLEARIDAYADMYKINDSNIRKTEKRLETAEEDAGVAVPPELQLVA